MKIHKYKIILGILGFALGLIVGYWLILATPEKPPTIWWSLFIAFIFALIGLTVGLWLGASIDGTSFEIGEPIKLNEFQIQKKAYTIFISFMIVILISFWILERFNIKSNISIFIYPVLLIGFGLLAFFYRLIRHPSGFFFRSPFYYNSWPSKIFSKVIGFLSLIIGVYLFIFLLLNYLNQ